MDFNTCQKLLLTQVHRSSDTDVEQAAVAIINAMDYYKGRRFNFNHGWQQVFLPEGVARLNSLVTPLGLTAMQSGLPHGMIRPIVIQVTAIVTSGDIDTGLGLFTYTPVFQAPLRMISQEEMWDSYGSIGDLSSSTPGFPKFFCWIGGANSPTNAIRIAPVPHTDLVADVFFVEDSHRPRYQYVSGSWVFEQLVFAHSASFWRWDTLRPEFSNVWLQHAEPMIRARAMFDLELNFYRDKEATEYARIFLNDEERRMIHERATGELDAVRRVPSSL